MNVEYQPIDADEAYRMSPLQLAYIGDNVWELYVRTALIKRKMNVNHMHKLAVEYVNAHAQSIALRNIQDLLTQKESDIVHRGRNCHSKHPSPKNQNSSDYSNATAFQALIGYLYLIGDNERLQYIFKQIVEESICRKEKN